MAELFLKKKKKKSSTTDTIEPDQVYVRNNQAHLKLHLLIKLIEQHYHHRGKARWSTCIFRSDSLSNCQTVIQPLPNNWDKVFNMNQIAFNFHWQIIKIKLMKDKTLVCCTDACQLASRWAESGSFPSRTVNSTCSQVQKSSIWQILLYSHYILNGLNIFGNTWVRTSQTCGNKTETKMFF